MGFVEGIKGIIEDFKIAQERRAKEKKRKTLENFFISPVGQKYLNQTLRQWNIDGIRRKKISTIDNNLREFRLAVYVDEDVFRNIVRERKPEIIKYRIVNRTDVIDAGYLLIEVDDKIAIETSGIIFPQASGVVGIFDKIPEVHYTPIVKEYHSFQPWQELALKINPKQ